MKILIVEDNPGDRVLLRETLRGENFLSEIVEVDRLSKAKSELSKNSFDVVLLDLSLPDSLGLATLKDVKEIGPEIPFVILTGHDDLATAVEALRLGAQDYQVKGSYSGDSLVRAITYSIERKATEQRLLNQERALQSASKMIALGEVAAFICHEINNPLNAISMNSQLMLIKLGKNIPLDNSQIQKFATSVNKSVEQITKIICGIRGFARDAENDPFQNFNVSEIVNEAVELSVARFRTQSIKCSIERPESDLMLECRPIQVSQILINLLNNAYDAIQVLPEKWIKLEIKDIGESVEFSVTDSGLGLPKAHADQILESFFTSKPQGKGTGLGLMISKRLAEEHGGSIFLDRSSPNTRFVLTLPQKQRNLRI